MLSFAASIGACRLTRKASVLHGLREHLELRTKDARVALKCFKLPAGDHTANGVQVPLKSNSVTCCHC